MTSPADAPFEARAVDGRRLQVSSSRTGRSVLVREKHSWPPSVAVYESWREPFAELARENGFQPEDVDQAAAALTQLIETVDAAQPLPG